MKKLNEGETLVKELHAMKWTHFKEALYNQPLTCVLRGLWVFCEGTSLVVLSLFAIYMAHNQSTWPLAWRWVLSVAGVFVLVLAAPLLARFFRSVGEMK